MAINTQPCELCAQAPPDQWLRDRGTISKARTNRTRLDAYYAGKVGHPEWAGLLICHSCGIAISKRINRL